MDDQPTGQGDQPSSEEPKKPAYGYGRGRWKRWVLIYLVAAAIIYLIIYLAFFSNGYGD